jgi:hypothetical protein
MGATPRKGGAKPNTDAGYCPNTGDASSGIVIRDRNGRVLLSAWRTWEHMASAEEAEAVTWLEGIRLAVEWVRMPLVIESDCIELIKALGRDNMS